MKRLVTLAVFDNIFDVKFNLLKDMLEEAGIEYLTGNENSRSVKPVLSIVPSNISIDIKVYEENLDDAVRIMKSIE